MGVLGTAGKKRKVESSLGGSGEDCARPLDKKLEKLRFSLTARCFRSKKQKQQRREEKTYVAEMDGTRTTGWGSLFRWAKKAGRLTTRSPHLTKGQPQKELSYR